MMRTRIHGLGFIGGRLASIRLPRGCVDFRLQPQVDQKSRNETLVLRESPLPLRAIPNCQMDGSPPPPPPVLPPSMAEPLAPLSSPSRIPGDELRPRGDSPRKSRLYCHQQSMERNVKRHRVSHGAPTCGGCRSSAAGPTVRRVRDGCQVRPKRK